jgi:hypothetical protein
MIPPSFVKAWQTSLGSIQATLTFLPQYLFDRRERLTAIPWLSTEKATKAVNVSSLPVTVNKVYSHSSCVLHAPEWFNLVRDVDFKPGGGRSFLVFCSDDWLIRRIGKHVERPSLVVKLVTEKISNIPNYTVSCYCYIERRLVENGNKWVRKMQIEKCVCCRRWTYEYK